MLAFACTTSQAAEHISDQGAVPAGAESELARFAGTDSLMLPLTEAAMNVATPLQTVMQHTHSLYETPGGWMSLAAVLLLSQIPLTLVILLPLRRRRSRWTPPAADDPIDLADAFGKLGFWRWDADTDRLSATERCRRMIGFGPADDLTPATFLTNVHPDDRALVSASVDRALAEGTPYDAEYRVVLPGGIVRWIAAKGRTLYERSDRPTGLVGITADVTQEKESELEARVREQELAHLTRVATLGTLSGSLAHELTQPLTAILSNAQAAQQLITRQPVDIGRIGDILADIVDDDARAGKIIQGLRTLLKKEQASTHPLDLNELLSDVVVLVHSQCVERGITLVVSASGDPAMVVGDRVQLQQVLLNLIMNACEALEARVSAPRRITISIEIVGRCWIELAIADTGGGIPDGLLSCIFEPYTTSKAQGMGLGLSISRSIVKSHGGTLCALNNTSGGATLELRLPAIWEGQT